MCAFLKGFRSFSLVINQCYELKVMKLETKKIAYKICS